MRQPLDETADDGVRWLDTAFSEYRLNGAFRAVPESRKGRRARSLQARERSGESSLAGQSAVKPAQFIV